MLADISPAKRKAVARKIGQRLRRSNLSRIAANVEPDGGAMEQRKPQRDRRGRIRKKAGGRMFRKLRYARNFKVKPREDGVEIAMASQGLRRIARVHHFGLSGYVGKTRAGDTVRARYEARQLLGFSAGDIDGIAEEALAWLDQD
ncbi:MAG: phage virion morphogenesis protein [Gammaproteobacteria bacterium]|nr:phage virion morphogenesis protein [Gammaproteobacteria bacterium]